MVMRHLHYNGTMFGLIGGIAASTSAIMELQAAYMAPPCYVQWLTTGLSVPPTVAASVRCCGHFMNITVKDVDPSSFCLLGEYA
ncbi:unnamed protein product [Strongylus vulgaris]|uniref:Uncharacterized protein n=1 Tax=Strongylus vulgaris TaxID=40348 RepID=A0A3P7K6F1_STRVU|nr:unnamed protein product [Strongylus vulgaris]